MLSTLSADNAPHHSSAPSPCEPPLVFGVADACRQLSIKNTTFFELVKTGRLKTFSLGRKRLVTREELARFVAEASRA